MHLLLTFNCVHLLEHLEMTVFLLVLEELGAPHLIYRCYKPYR